MERSIPVSAVRETVDRAVQIAGLRRDNGASGRSPRTGDFFAFDGWLIGRLLRESLELGKAHELSTGIAEASASELGLSVDAVTIAIGGDILVGFIERFGEGRIDVATFGSTLGGGR